MYLGGFKESKKITLFKCDVCLVVINSAKGVKEVFWFIFFFALFLLGSHIKFSNSGMI